MSESSLEWEFDFEPPPAGLNSKFFKWVQTMEDELDIIIGKWSPLSREGRLILQNSWEVSIPDDFIELYKYSDPWGLLKPRSDWKSKNQFENLRLTKPYWPIDISGYSSSCIDAIGHKSDKDELVIVTLVQNSKIIAELEGIRNYFVSLVLIEATWVTNSFSENLKSEEVQKYLYKV